MYTVRGAKIDAVKLVLSRDVSIDVRGVTLSYPHWNIVDMH